MVWLLVAISIYAINFVAGRAHSRRLDRLEARSKLIDAFMKMESLSRSSDIFKEVGSADDLTSETICQTPIDSLGSFFARIETGAWPREADNRGINYEIRLICDEGELLETYDLREMAAAASGPFAKQKDRPKAVSVIVIDFDRAANMALLRRRYASVPMPGNPGIIRAREERTAGARIVLRRSDRWHRGRNRTRSGNRSK
jgi:hypothetical protein